METKSKFFSVLLFCLATVAAVLYLWFVLKGPIITSTEALREYTTKIKFVRLALSFGYIVSWIAAAYAVGKLWNYQKLLKSGKDHQGFQKIFIGLLIIFIGSLLWPPLTAVRILVLSNAPALKLLTFVFNFSMIYPTVIGFYFIYKGSKNLLEAVKVRSNYSFSLFKWFLPVLALPVYLWMLFNNPQRSVSTAPGVPSTFYLPDPLIAILIVLPVVGAWILGIISIVNLNTFRKRSPGLIYRVSLPSLYFGITCVIFGSALLQAVVSVGSNKLLQLGYVALVLTIYTFAGMLATGFLLIARSMKRLTQIENI